VKVKRAEGLMCGASVCVRRDNVGPEGKQRAHLVWPSLGNRAVDISGGHPSLCGRPNGPFIEPERLGPLLRTQKRIRADGVGRLFRKLAVRPARIE
jgi:hypothetical protein